MQAHTHAAAFGQARNDETGSVGALPGLHSTTHSADSARRIAGLQARFKSRGFDLQRLPTGALLVCRWGQSRELDLEGAETFARKVGAA